MSPNNREGSHGMGVIGGSDMKVLESPSAGRVIVDTFVKSAELLLTTSEGELLRWDGISRKGLVGYIYMSI